jgi:valyl-tRNA synthetase
VLRIVLGDSMKLLHPFMPFITAEIFDALRGTARADLIISPWPVYDAAREAAEDTRKMRFVMSVIRGVRNLRTEMGAPPAQKVRAVFVTDDADKAGALREGRPFVERLAAIRAFQIQDGPAQGGESAPPAGRTPSDGLVTLVVEGVEILIPLGELVDVEKEILRLEKEWAALQKERERAAERLANEDFVSKAPARVIDAEREKLKKYEEMCRKVGENLRRMKGESH